MREAGTRLRQVPGRGSTSGADPARLLDNGSTLGSRRRPEPLLPGAGETPQLNQKRARRPACARRVGGALLPALAAIIAVSLSVQGHAQTSVPHDWGLKPSGLNTGEQFRLIFLSSTKRDGSATDIATYNTFVQTRAAAATPRTRVSQRLPPDVALRGRAPGPPSAAPGIGDTLCLPHLSPFNSNTPSLTLQFQHPISHPSIPTPNLSPFTTPSLTLHSNTQPLTLHHTQPLSPFNSTLHHTPLISHPSISNTQPSPFNFQHPTLTLQFPTPNPHPSPTPPHSPFSSPKIKNAL